VLHTADSVMDPLLGMLTDGIELTPQPPALVLTMYSPDVEKLIDCDDPPVIEDPQGAELRRMVFELLEVTAPWWR